MTYDWQYNGIKSSHWCNALIQFPATLGDFAGIIISGDSEFKKGDEVYGIGILLNGSPGSFAEYIFK